MTNQLGSGWMQTYSGRRFTPMSPRLEDIFLEDITGALSKMCRYGGHCLRFYSVAEHCVLASRAVAPEFRLTTLLHDASEAYLVDVPRPIKGHLGGYYEAEDHLAELIAKRFGTIYPLPPEVKHIDQAMLRDERRQAMARMDVDPEDWGDTLPGVGVELKFWAPDMAAYEFQTAFFEYGGRV